MAAASCTLTGTIKDIIGAAMDPSQVVVNLVASVPLIIDSGTGEMRVGQKQIKPDLQGRWTFTNVWLTDTANTNPASFRWKIVLQAWPDKAAPRAVFESSDFALTTPGVVNIKDVDFVPVDPDPGWKSIFQGQMEGLLAQANTAAAAAQTAAGAAAVDAAQDVKDEILSQVLPQPAFFPCASVPPGMTLDHTYQVSASGLNYSAYDWVYVVAAGAGGGQGYNGTNHLGGGAGACVQGWVRGSLLTSVTIGAGGTSIGVSTGVGGNGGDTLAGPIRACGGCGGGVGGNTNPLIKPGAGQGGMWSNTPTGVPYPSPVAYGMFSGGAAGNTTFPPGVATSGGGSVAGKGGDGLAGPGGGCGVAATPGGTSYSPNGNTYTPTGTGGAGILGLNTSDPTSGGPGGGAGGNAATTATGKGGDGCVLIYVPTP